MKRTRPIDAVCISSPDQKDQYCVLRLCTVMRRLDVWSTELFEPSEEVCGIDTYQVGKVLCQTDTATAADLELQKDSRPRPQHCCPARDMQFAKRGWGFPLLLRQANC